MSGIEYWAKFNKEADGLLVSTDPLALLGSWLELKKKVAQLEEEVEDLRGCGMVAPADFDVSSWADLKKKIAHHDRFAENKALKSALRTLLQRFEILELVAGGRMTGLRFPDARDRAAMKQAREILGE